MTSRAKIENPVLAAPMVLFLLLLLGFPVVLSLVYGFSAVSFETLQSPQFNGLANFRTVIADDGFWAASLSASLAICAFLSFASRCTSPGAKTWTASSAFAFDTWSK